MTRNPQPPEHVAAYPPLGEMPPGIYPASMVVPTSRLAVASLVVGIVAVLACFIPVIPGAIAAVLGFMAIQRTGPMKLAGRGLAVAGLVLGCCAVFMSILSLSIWLPAFSQGRESAQRVKCASNVRQIGSALIGYALDHNGYLPPDLATLQADPTTLVQAQTLICPSTNHKAGGGLPLFGQNLSYIYTGGGKMAAMTSDHVLLYEPVAHHGRDGAHFYLLDGSVKFIPRTQARAMIQQLEKGINPPDPNALAPPDPAERS